MERIYVSYLVAKFGGRQVMFSGPKMILLCSNIKHKVYDKPKKLYSLHGLPQLVFLQDKGTDNSTLQECMRWRFLHFCQMKLIRKKKARLIKRRRQIQSQKEQKESKRKDEEEEKKKKKKLKTNAKEKIKIEINESSRTTMRSFLIES